MKKIVKKIILLTFALSITIMAAMRYSSAHETRGLVKSNIPYVVLSIEPEEADATVQEDTFPEDAHVSSTCTGEVKQIFDLVNSERAAAGLPALVWSDKLAEAAQQRSKECAILFAHTRPDGTPYFTVSPLVSAENLIRDGVKISPEAAMNAWMNSEGHRTNILYPTLNKIGIAILDCELGRVIVQSFGF